MRKHADKIPVLISFSGMDGAGKSTQIESLCAALHAAGLKTRRLAFWDDVVVGVKYREGFVHKVYKSERGVGAPGKPVHRRDKNMRGWHLTVSRHFLYLLDALRLRRVIAQEKLRAGDVIILDRYIYDELANLNLQNSFTRRFAKFVCGLVPSPDLACVLDADPMAAYARKPEYPVDFMMQCRKRYFDLCDLIGTMTVIPASALPQARLAVLKAAGQCLEHRGVNVDLISGSLSVA